MIGVNIAAIINPAIIDKNNTIAARIVLNINIIETFSAYDINHHLVFLPTFP